jgi:PIN domain nuclease of toxin-antitoxin system
MNYLLDTCTLLWVLDKPECLGKRVGKILAEASTISVSVISAWEIQVKYQNGKLPLDRPPTDWWDEELRQRGYAALSLNPSAIFMLNRLPDHHKDPFDRMLICQALHHGLTILTPDPLIRQYPVSVIWD